MPATDEELLLVRIEARLTQFEKAMAQATGGANRAAGRIESRFRSMERNLSSVGAGLARSLLTPLLALGSAREIGQAADAFTRIQNALKVAGVEGERATQVFDRLFAAAQRNAAPVESLVELYGRAALVQGELNVSSEELLRFTEGVAAALRVSGKSAAESSGALLQLSQALGSGVVRAEEFNSVLEGALPIAQAAARGLEEAGGSVAKLRTLVIEGKVSSEAFFRAFEAGQGSLETLAATADTTLGQAMTRLENSLIAAVGRFNELTGVSRGVISVLGGISAAMEELVGWVDRLDGSKLAALIQKLAQLNNLVAKVLPGGVIFDVPEIIDNLNEKAKELVDGKRIEVSGGRGGGGGAGRSAPITPVSLKNLPPPGTGGGSKRSPAERFAEEMQRLKERTEALRLDTLLLGQNTEAIAGAQAAQDLLNAAQRAGIEITPTVLAGIDAQANAYGQASAEYEKAAAQQQRLVEIQSEIVDLGISSLRGLIDGTKDWNDVLNDTLGLLEDIVAQQLKTALVGGNGGGGLLSGLFHPAGTKLNQSGFAGLFAEGGTIPAGKFGIVGERGPEFVQGPATVTPASGVNLKVVTNNYNTESNVTQRMNGRDLEILIDTRVARTLQRSAGTNFGRSIGLSEPRRRA